MVEKTATPNQRYPALPDFDTGHGKQPEVPTAPSLRPWHQWHTAMQPVHTRPLEVITSKRPQWGRFIYLAIILAITIGIVHLIFDQVFWYNASGIVSGQRYNVSTTYAGIIKNVAVGASDQVQAGQVLATLDSPQLRNEIAQADTSLAQLRQQAVTHSPANEIATLRAQEHSYAGQAAALNDSLQLQTQRIDALRTLVTQGAANGGDLIPLQTQLASTQSQYAEVHAGLVGVHAQLRNIKKDERSARRKTNPNLVATIERQRDGLRATLDNLTITAPISGRVARVDVSKGAVLRPGDNAFVIVSSADSQTYLFFPPAAQNRLYAGKDVDVTGPDGHQIRMQITRIYPSLQDAPTTLDPGQNLLQTPKIVVAAQPVPGTSWPEPLRSGTPVNARVPRWSTPTLWVTQAKRLASAVVREARRLIEQYRAPQNTSAPGPHLDT